MCMYILVSFVHELRVDVMRPDYPWGLKLPYLKLLGPDSNRSGFARRRIRTKVRVRDDGGGSLFGHAILFNHKTACHVMFGTSPIHTQHWITNSALYLYVRSRPIVQWNEFI